VIHRRELRPERARTEGLRDAPSDFELVTALESLDPHSMNCPACSAPIDVSTDLPGSEVRCACGTMVHVPAKPSRSARAGGAARPRACPRCAAALVEAATLGGLGAHACPECGGVFADRAAVAALSSGTLAPAAEPVLPARKVDTSGYIKCPVCDDLMKRVNFGRRSGVLVDVCVDHGTWFDADEIDRVAAFLASGGLVRGGGSALDEGPQLSAEGRKQMGELQAQVVQERYDDMARVERATWFTRVGIRLLFDWF
jgi:Zn-finger nucleic acid-binding protein